MGTPVSQTAARWSARLLAIVLAIGGLAAIAVPFVLSFTRHWPNDLYKRSLILGGVTAAILGLALFVQVFLLLSRRRAGPILRAKVLYSTFWGGPIGWVWSVFLLTRKVTSDPSPEE